MKLGLAGAVGVALILSFLGCAAAPVARAWTLTERPSEVGAYYGTFQSHLPTFARTREALYRARTVDIGEAHAGRARTSEVELRIDRLSDGEWRTIIQRGATKSRLPSRARRYALCGRER